MIKMPSFKYLNPDNIQEACLLLSEHKGNARLIAGGTDLLISLKNREIMPEYVINLDSIPELNYIRYDGGSLSIGALATIQDLESSPVVKESFPVLADAARQMGSPQIRNMATVIGNICRAAPSADMAPVMIGLGAKLRTIYTGGERIINIDEFFVGPGETGIDNTEILVEIQVPAMPPNTRGVYLKIARREAVSIAFTGVAVIVTMDSNNAVIEDVKIVLGAVASTPVRAGKAEELLKGKVVDSGLIEEAAKAAAKIAAPISDIRCSAGYRSEMVKVLVSRALKKVATAA